MSTIRVGVVDDHEVYRRGLVACLVDDPQLSVTDLGGSPTPIDPAIGSDAEMVDVLVISSTVMGLAPSRPAVVCCSDESDAATLSTRDNVHAVLQRRTVRPDQLVAAVHAAAAGLHINGEPSLDRRITDRSRDVLRLLAGGADTREISRALGYSERTIKAAIADVQVVLGTRTRAHAVAEAMRANLI